MESFNRLPLSRRFRRVKPFDDAHEPVCVRWLVLTSCLMLVLAPGVPLQAPAGQVEPTVGQPGKDVMWVPTPPELVSKMLEMANVSPRDVVIDLGSGDGRTVIAAAKLGVRAIGVEYDAALVELSKNNAAEAAVADRATFVKADLFEVDLSQATVITMFLLPELNLKLRPRLLDLAPGTRIVSNTWDLEDWKADETVVISPCPAWCTSLLWIVPAQVGGVWQLEDSQLTLEQQFQVVSGTLRTGGEVVQIEEGRLRGEQISFRVGDTVYTGRANGAVIEGVAETETRTFTWSASLVTR